jgi:hypothetical protein
MSSHRTPRRHVGITENLTHADSRVREDDHERPVPGYLQRRVLGSLLVEWVHVIGKGGVGVVYASMTSRACSSTCRVSG